MSIKIHDIEWDTTYIFDLEEFKKKFFTDYADVIEYAKRSKRIVDVAATVEPNDYISFAKGMVIKAYAYMYDDKRICAGFKSVYPEDNTIVSFIDDEFYAEDPTMDLESTYILDMSKQEFLDLLIEGLREYKPIFKIAFKSNTDIEFRNDGLPINSIDIINLYIEKAIICYDFDHNKYIKLTITNLGDVVLEFD